MTAAALTHTCPVCGAEESLDALMARMVDDDEVRRLISAVLTCSLQLGSLTLRYLRLHKPPKHRLRLEKVRALLGELLPDMQRLAITRKGRDWAVPLAVWKDGFEAVFTAAQAGSLTLPLEGNGYLYEVLLRQADRTEGAAERDTEAQRRSRAHEGEASSAGELLAKLPAWKGAPLPEPAAPRILTTPPPGYDRPSPFAQRVAAENAARKAALQGGQVEQEGGAA